ncbi:gfo/Idh/MocA family oxidoreductase [Opitutaceae bacterium TAV4]|uniref:Gfo/Idh/MocA family protein n=1 Tax=Geminisphaera colitermitum TaxID=1148786 RepID=UPI000158C5A0|nr:Gfo/Idh/MocA family oxidoreductase [Geminisphaera colitermitum]RRJ94603.1 gfo/Idh/MocA family oxidoreductase [Opitutaceae bacterium TAV4]RRJ98669.1 gfo/Idh/MocA family oxidoreductase [Opitutaceae bacterium TAV3]
MKPKPIKIGQIGIGHNHASEKMNTLRRLPHLFEVVGVVEDDPVWRERRGNMAAYAGLPWMTEEELFKVPGLEAVAVETDGFDLVPTAKRCAARGLHMHLDKPGGESLPAFKSLLDDCERQNLCIQLGYMYRNNPAINFCKHAVRAGWLGEIFEIHAVMSRLDNDDYRKWLSNFKGGALYIFGGYLIDIIISMLGRPDSVVPFQGQTRDDGLCDNGFAVLRYPRATASIRTSVVEIEGFKRRQLVVCGTKGTVEVCPLEHHNTRYALDPLHVKLTLAEPCGEYTAGTHIVDVGIMNGRYTEQLTELARIIRGEMKNPFPLHHEFLVQEALLAAAGY